jgi:hypothetical protein
MSELLVNIIVPDYPDKVQVAAARRAIYYVSPTSTKKGRKAIPKSFLNPEKYFFNADGVLYNKRTEEPQLANPKSAGQPRYWVVNFQDIYNQNLGKQARAGHVNKLKDLFRPFIVPINPITQFPIEISFLIYDTTCPVDVSNRGAVYTKVIEDLLVKEGKMPDDSIDYVNCSGRIKFIKVEDVREKRMEIRINKSDNKPF